MRRLMVGTWIVLLPLAAVGQVPVTGVEGATLADIVGTETLVTVVLSRPGAEDSNLTIVDVHENYITVVSASGEENYYRFVDIKEIRVQGGLVEAKALRPRKDMMLTGQQQQALGRAVQRAQEIFQSSNDNQPFKMAAAVVMIVAGGDEAAQAAREYLASLAESNDIRVGIDAGLRLYLAGEPLPVDMIEDGLQSGTPRVRSQATFMAGLVGDHESEPMLYKMLQDRAAEFSAPAARALSILGNRDAIPELLAMLVERNERKSSAAVFGLSLLGGDDVIEQLKLMLNSSEGLARFRVAKVLYTLGEPSARRLLREEIILEPALQVEAAALLARDGDIKAMQTLRERLERKFEPTEENLLWRADAIAALVAANDRTMLGPLMDLRRAEFPAVKARVYDLVAELGQRSFIVVIQPGIEESDLAIALKACETVVALTDSAYRERLLLNLR
ncbi:MAG: HEAT repeat domain-containing protein [Candidatus Hydrogenedentes bacterium]|nr:HEAT repeat domain-containing protein [Candidatus Hydrogenedentota bacterium]